MAVKGKVLIVEDDRAICSFMRRVLEAEPSCALVSRGADGIELF